ncbi:sunset domain-containing protein [Paenibacillus lautus]
MKGNINSKGEKIYHTPESPYYNKTSRSSGSAAKARQYEPVSALHSNLIWLHHMLVYRRSSMKIVCAF